jgi:S1-C subfamily serine protease
MSPRPFGVRLAIWLGLVALFACSSPTVDELGQAVVRVESLPCGRSGVGSGSVLDRDLVLTNAHIVAGSNDDVTVRTWDDRVFDGLVVGFDSERDLALIRVDGLDIDGLALNEPVEGEATRILARPVGLDLEVLDATILRLINATGDDIYGEGDVSRRAMELSVDVGPGVSGGAVVNESGHMVGIVFADSRRREELSYAVDAQEVRAFVDEIDPEVAADTLRCRN